MNERSESALWDKQFERLIRHYLPFLPPDEQLGAGLSLPNHGLDSIRTVELLDAVESAYGVRFVGDSLRAETFETAGSLWRVVSAMRESAG